MSVVLALAALLPLALQDPVERAIGALRTEDAGRRRAALEDLEKLGASAIPTVLRALEGVAPASPDRIRQLLGQLASKGWKERDEAMQALVRLGRSALPGLEGIGSDGDPEVVWRVRSALSEIKDRAGKEDLLEELQNSSLCDFLGEIGDERAVGPLLGVLSGGGSELRPDLKIRAADALGKLAQRLRAPQAEEATEKVLALFEKTPSPLQKGLLIRVLGRLHSPSSVRPLSALLSDRSEKNLHLKRACLIALSRTGDPAALRLVIESVGSPDPYLRQAAVAAIEEASGGASGVDLRGGAEENREAIGRLKSWWSKKFGKAWE
jgi:HEAT repeat protein